MNQTPKILVIRDALLEYDCDQVVKVLTAAGYECEVVSRDELVQKIEAADKPEDLRADYFQRMLAGGRRIANAMRDHPKRPVPEHQIKQVADTMRVFMPQRRGAR